MKSGISSSARMYGIVAREAPVAVLFRRGPTKSVLLIRWDTERDTFEIGQWLRGRIYERRCDLSPDGELLIYFAAKQKPPLYSWTAVSRPPYLTALALWPKGDCWGGGGLFASRRHILLNHWANQMKLADGFAIPRLIQVSPFGERSGWGEDDPIWQTRLLRDGWRLECKGETRKHDLSANVMFEYEPAIRYSRVHPRLPKRYRLEMEISGVKEKNGAWYVTEHAVMRGDAIDALGRTEWADWLPNGDLVFTRGGQLWRMRYRSGALAPSNDAEIIADFSDLKFENKAAPEKMTRW